MTHLHHREEDQEENDQEGHEETMFDKLRQVLASIPQGPIPDAGEIGSILAEGWDEFIGDKGGMTGEKLIGRMEEVTWTPPHLTFTIERHGSTVLGSTKENLQDWTLNVEKKTAEYYEERYRRIKPAQPRLVPFPADKFRADYHA